MGGHGLYVVDETAYATIPDDTRERVREAFEGDGHGTTKTIAERAYERDIAVRRELRWGDPAVAIIAYSIENDIDLIVMGRAVKPDSSATYWEASPKRSCVFRRSPS